MSSTSIENSDESDEKNGHARMAAQALDTRLTRLNQNSPGYIQVNIDIASFLSSFISHIIHSSCATMGCCHSSPHSGRKYRDPADLDEEFVDEEGNPIR